MEDLQASDRLEAHPLGLGEVLAVDLWEDLPAADAWAEGEASLVVVAYQEGPYHRLQG